MRVVEALEAAVAVNRNPAAEVLRRVDGGGPVPRGLHDLGERLAVLEFKITGLPVNLGEEELSGHNRVGRGSGLHAGRVVVEE